MFQEMPPQVPAQVRLEVSKGIETEQQFLEEIHTEYDRSRKINKGTKLTQILIYPETVKNLPAVNPNMLKDTEECPIVGFEKKLHTFLNALCKQYPYLKIKSISNKRLPDNTIAQAQPNYIQQTPSSPLQYDYGSIEVDMNKLRKEKNFDRFIKTISNEISDLIMARTPSLQHLIIQTNMEAQAYCAAVQQAILSNVPLSTMIPKYNGYYGIRNTGTINSIEKDAIYSICRNTYLDIRLIARHMFNSSRVSSYISPQVWLTQNESQLPSQTTPGGEYLR